MSEIALFSAAVLSFLTVAFTEERTGAPTALQRLSWRFSTAKIIKQNQGQSKIQIYGYSFVKKLHDN